MWFVCFKMKSGEVFRGLYAVARQLVHEEKVATFCPKSLWKSTGRNYWK